MKTAAKAVLFFCCALFMVIQFQNCSTYSDNTMFANSLNPDPGTNVDPTVASIVVTTDDSDRFAVDANNQLSIGGKCRSGGKANNSIQYWVTNPANQPINIGAATGPQNTMNDARCENGKFYLVIHLNDPVYGGPQVGVNDYVLHVKISAWNTTADTLTAQTAAPVSITTN